MSLTPAPSQHPVSTRRDPAASSGESPAHAPNSYLLPILGTPWALAGAGAAWNADRRLAVIADLHLGYEWARAMSGDVLPRHSLAETQARLASLLDQLPVRELIIAGDVYESPAPCHRTKQDHRALELWLRDRGIALTLIRGNHDPAHLSPHEELVIDGWTITHGHRPSPAPRQILGHWHPSLKLGARATGCFIWNSRRILLPAFSCNAAGLDIAGLQPPADWQPPALRCAVWADTDWLDFGPLDTLATSLRQIAASPVR
jgi:putative SbcD/Mre11-related phosphoesterase